MSRTPSVPLESRKNLELGHLKCNSNLRHLKLNISKTKKLVLILTSNMRTRIKQNRRDFFYVERNSRGFQLWHTHTTDEAIHNFACAPLTNISPSCIAAYEPVATPLREENGLVAMRYKSMWTPGLTLRHAPGDGLVGLHGGHRGFKQFSLHINICGGFRHTLLNSSVMHLYLKKIISVWKKKNVTCLDIRAKVHQRTRKQVGLQTRARKQENRSRQKCLAHKFKFVQNMEKKKKNPDKSASSCTRTERRCHHIKAALGFIFEDESPREDLNLGNRPASKKPQNEPPIKRLAKTLSPLERNSPPWLRA